MENNYTVKEFIDKYNNKQVMLKDIVVNKYIPYAKKIVLADKLVSTTSKDEKGNFHVQTPYRYVLLTYTLINEYTCIHMSNKNMLDEFDKLNSLGLVKEIMNILPTDDVIELNNVIDATTRDYMTNNYEIHSFIAEQFDKVKLAMETFTNTFMPEVEKHIGNLKPEDIQALLKALK